MVFGVFDTLVQHWGSYLVIRIVFCPHLPAATARVGVGVGVGVEGRVEREEE